MHGAIELFRNDVSSSSHYQYSIRVPVAIAASLLYSNHDEVVYSFNYIYEPYQANRFGVFGNFGCLGHYGLGWNSVCFRERIPMFETKRILLLYCTCLGEHWSL